MEIYIEEPEAPAAVSIVPLLMSGARRPPPVLKSMVVKPFDPSFEEPLCETMTWDSSLSPAFVAAAWPGRNIKYVRCGRAFAPITEIPIAQIPYLVVVAKYFNHDVIVHGL
jgi:hypothetical protein